MAAEELCAGFGALTMAERMLFGWDGGTWRRVERWAASVGLDLPQNTPDRHYSRELALRSEWLKRGGPLAGPSGALVL